MSRAPTPVSRSSLSIRSLAELDLADVAAIESSVYAFPWSLGNFRDSLASGYDCLGVWLDAELVGYAVIMTALDEAHLLNLAVSSRWQGRGVGAALLEYVIEHTRRNRQEVLYLEVRPSNLAGNRLYERFGFTQLGLRKEYYPAVGGREDALFLGLNLSEPILPPEQ